jgi:hypothetical protein
MELFSDQAFLLKLLRTRMPFGRYEGLLLLRLPEAYVAWFARQGFPEGELGRMLALVQEIQVNGLEPLLEPLLRAPNRAMNDETL